MLFGPSKMLQATAWAEPQQTW